MERPFKKPPNALIRGIPVFTDVSDRYIENYERIASDHLASSADNPFMSDAQIADALSVSIDLIRPHLKAGDVVLDAGLGLGGLLEQLDDVERYGVDVSMSYLEIAASKGIEVALANIEDLPYRSAIFDVVIVTDVLEHVVKLDRAVEELLRVLKPGGKFLVRVPNEEDLSSYVSSDQPYEYTHLRSFSLDDLKLYLGKTWELSFVDHAFSGYLFGSSAQLLVKPPSQEVLSALEAIPEDIEAVSTLKGVSGASAEEVVDALINIRDEHPELAKSLMPLLVKPLDVSVIFQKELPKQEERAQEASATTTKYPHQGFGRVSKRPEEVLLLCYYEPGGVPTVPEMVGYLQILSEFSVTVLNMHVHRKDSGFVKLRRGLNLEAFRAVVIHNSLAYNIDNLKSLDSELDVKLAQYSGAKILLKQDENFRFEETAKYVVDTGFDLIFTCLPPESIDDVYPGAVESGARFERMLTGYVTPSIRALASRNGDRTIDIGYRGSVQELSFGRLAYEKRQIGDLVQSKLHGSGLTLDISSRWQDRLGGDSWIEFLANCKATLGSESGASVFDLQGELTRRCEKAEKELGPTSEDANYAESYLSYFEDLEGNVYYNQVSPRHFEAAATGTLQLLYPGAYSGIFEAGKHYFALARDGSNLNEAVELIKDDKRRLEITQRAYEEVICDPRYSVEEFVARFDVLLAQVLDGKRIASKPISKAPKGVNVVLLAAHEPSIDPRLGWIESHAKLPLRVHQAGVLPPEAASMQVDVTDNASLAMAYPRVVGRRGIISELFSIAGQNPAGVAGLQELSLIESALELGDNEFAKMFGCPVDHERNGQFKWYLRYILDTSVTLIENLKRRRGMHALIATDLDTLPAALVLKGIFNIPVLYDAHEYWAESDPGALEYEIQFWTGIEKRMVAHCDYCQTVSPGLASLMSEQYEKVFHVVPNCEPLRPRLKNRPIRQAQCRFLFQGNFAPRRGFEILINSWKDTDKDAILYAPRT